MLEPVSACWDKILTGSPMCAGIRTWICEARSLKDVHQLKHVQWMLVFVCRGWRFRWWPRFSGALHCCLTQGNCVVASQLLTLHSCGSLMINAQVQLLKNSPVISKIESICIPCNDSFWLPCEMPIMRNGNVPPPADTFQAATRCPASDWTAPAC